MQYFLVNSMRADDLARHEQELLRFYCDALASYGVSLGEDEARTQYRAFRFQPRMTIVTSLGLGPLTENNTLMTEVLARALAAVERADFY
ncbi:MAG: hypothetical protein ACK55I_40570, partial [bacterium]